MRFRTIYGALMIGAIGILVVLDSLFIQEMILGSLLMLLQAILGWTEYARITGIAGTGQRRSPGLYWTGLTAVAWFFVIAWIGSRRPLPGGEEEWMLGGLAGLCLLTFLQVVLRGDFDRLYGPLLETIVGVVIIGLLPSYFVRIYRIPGWQGPVFWAILVAGVKGNDMAAYFVGKTWGKHHFLKVSPRKTLEGSLGALAFSMAYFALAGGVVQSLAPQCLFSASGGILFGMVVSLASQAGDLAESLFKRVYQVKDSGALLPEFGGALDMTDSLVFTGFLLWWVR